MATPYHKVLRDKESSFWNECLINEDQEALKKHAVINFENKSLKSFILLPWRYVSDEVIKRISFAITTLNSRSPLVKIAPAGSSNTH